MEARPLAERDLPGDVAAAQLVGGDPRPGRLGDRQVEGAVEARDPSHEVEGGAVRVRTSQRDQDGRRERRHVEPSRVRVEGAAGPARAALEAGHGDGAALAGRREHGAVLVGGQDALRLGANLGREVDQVGELYALAVEGRRPGGEGLCGRGLLTGDAGLRDLPFLDRPYRFARLPVEDVEKRLLAGQHRRLDRATVDLDVAEDSRRGEVVVPEAVVNGLEVPAALACLAVDGDQALGEQVVAAAVAAVPVVRWRAGRQVGEAELLVGAHQAPDVRAAGDAPGLVLPGVGSDLPLLRHGVEGPELPAGAHVETADVAGRSVVGTERTVGDG